MTDKTPYSIAALLSILAMVAMIILYSLTALGYMGPNPVGRGDTYTEPLIVPAGYAFSIWSIIYLSLIIWPIYRYFKTPEYHLMWVSVHRWYGFNVVANGLWLVAASYDFQILTVVIIIFMLFTLYKIYQALRVLDHLDRTSYWIDRFGFSVYFAWVTLATALNVSSALAFYEWGGWGISQESWALTILPVAIIIAGYIGWKYKDLAYTAVPIWALIALIVKRLDTVPSLGYLSIALVGILGVMWILIARQPNRLT